MSPKRTTRTHRAHTMPAINLLYRACLGGEVAAAIRQGDRSVRFGEETVGDARDGVCVPVPPHFVKTHKTPTWVLRNIGDQYSPSSQPRRGAWCAVHVNTSPRVDWKKGQKAACASRVCAACLIGRLDGISSRIPHIWATTGDNDEAVYTQYPHNTRFSMYSTTIDAQPSLKSYGE